MGTALKPKYNFSKLHRAREAYWRAFSKNRTDVCSAISDRSLDDLNAVRNVIVHRAGFADAEFVAKRPKRPPFHAVQIGDRIPIDGPTVESLIKPAMETSIRLLRSVDQWIVTNPEKTRP
jgi:hypothetical protein